MTIIYLDASREPVEQSKAVFARVIDARHGISRTLLITSQSEFAENFDWRSVPRAPSGSPIGGRWIQKLDKTNERAWDGTQVELENPLSKLETGEEGERLAILWERKFGKKPDMRTLNIDRNNYPVDLIGDHEIAEVKAGLASNGKSAQHWRATIGQPGPAERAWLKRASPKAKERWHAKKQQAIIDRKNAALRSVQKSTGRKIRAHTIGVIINPDKRVVDIYKFKGFHSRIAWASEQAKKGYVGSYRY